MGYPTHFSGVFIPVGVLGSTTHGTSRTPKTGG